MKISVALKKIDEISRFSMNQEQKALVKKMLSSAPENQVGEWYAFLIQKVKLGFVFDLSPSLPSKHISLVRENMDLSFVAQATKEKNKNVLNLEKQFGEHKLIIGENYDALKNLLLTHKNKIDLIYIDPPYNTEMMKNEGNFSSDPVSSQKFCYKDKFAKTGWLNFMWERLKLAKDLLTDVGVIFISIDDNQQAYLKVLMDDIFGEEKFIKNLIYQTNSSVMKGSKDFRKDHEYILVYSKSGSFCYFNKMKKDKISFQNPDNDLNGCWISTNATYKLNEKSKNYFPIKSGKNTWWRTWRFSKETLQKGKVNLLLKDNNVPRIKIYKKDYKMEETPSTIINLNLPLSKDGIPSFTKAKTELSSILDNDFFSTPKPVGLIKWLIKRVKNRNITVLDFFAGSGTTGHAVLDLNREDGGNRQFILVTNNENNIGRDVCYERLYRIIKGKSSERKKINWTIKNKPFVNVNLRVFEITYKDVSIGENIDSLESEIWKELRKINLNLERKTIDYWKLSSLLTTIS